MSNLTVVAKPHPLSSDVVMAEYPIGSSIAEIIGPGATCCRVEIAGQEIAPEWWPRIRPKQNTPVLITRFPQGGMGVKDILRLVAFAALAVATYGVASGVIFGSLSAMAALGVAAGIGIAGSLLIAALIPPSKPLAPANTSFTTLQGITGTQNQANPYGSVPCVIGTMRLFPTLAALPFSELSGNDQYVRFLFDIGYGSPSISVMKIGENDLANFTDIETQIGTSPGLFSSDITETAAGDVLNADGNNAVRTGAINADEMGVDVVFPSGLFGVDSKGNAINVSCDIRVEVTLTGHAFGSAVPSLPGGVSGIGLTISNPAAVVVSDIFRVTSSARTTLRIGFRWKCNSGFGRAQYDVRVTRVSTNWGTAVAGSRFGDLTWAILRTIRYTNPSTTGTEKVALRIKATDQLNGTINQFNCTASQPIPVWNGTAWVSSLTGNNNPAYVFRWVMCDSPANPRRVDHSRVDDAALIAWGAECTAKEFTYDFVHDQPSIVFDVIKDICAAGRASFTVRDGKYSVVRDIAQTVPVQHFSPRNSWGFQGKRSFIDQVQALRAQLVNPQASYQQDEVIVYDDGFSADGAGGTTIATKFETFQLRGCTNANGAWRLARYHLAVARLRPNMYTWNADIEHIVCTRGDLVKLAHDVISAGLAWGRLKTVTPIVNMVTVSEPTAAQLSVNTGTSTDTSLIGFAHALHVPSGATHVESDVRPVYGTGNFVFSIFIAMDDGTQPQIGTGPAPADFDLQFNNANWNATQLQQISTTLWRAAVAVNVAVVSGPNPTCGIVRQTTHSGKGFTISGFQLESGTVMSPYQPTTSNVLGQATALTTDEAMDFATGTTYGMRVRSNDGGTHVVNVTPAQKNLVLWSEDATHWTGSGSGTGTAPVLVSANVGQDLAGGMTLDRWTLNKGAGTTGSDFCTLNIGSSSSATDINAYAYSIELATAVPGATAKVAMRISGSVVLVTLTNTVTRLVCLRPFNGTPADTTPASIWLRTSFGTDNSADILIGRAQVELGTAFTSYSKTAGAGSGFGLTTVNLATPQANINPGDLFLFGVSGSESIDMIVMKIEPGQDLSAMLTAVDAAPAVLTADSGTPPVFVSNITGASWNDPPPPPDLIIVASGEANSPPDDGGINGPGIIIGVGRGPSHIIRLPRLSTRSTS